MRRRRDQRIAFPPDDRAVVGAAIRDIVEDSQPRSDGANEERVETCSSLGFPEDPAAVECTPDVWGLAE